MIKEVDLLEQQDIRQDYLIESNIELLHGVKEILLFPSSQVLTVDKVAQYFEVPYDTLKRVINRHEEELLSNGMYKLSRRDFNEYFVKSTEGTDCPFSETQWTCRSEKYYTIAEFNGQEQFKVTNRGVTLLTKRAILNVGMLLQDSPVAQELRKRLLDIVADAESGQGDIQEIINEIDDEADLWAELTLAMRAGNMSQVIITQTKINELRNRRIQELEEEIISNAPKVTYANAVEVSEGSISVGSFAKLLKDEDIQTGRNRMFKWLRNNEYINKDNTPRQTAIKQGLLELVQYTYTLDDGSTRTVLKSHVTGKGQIYFTNKLKNCGLI